MKTSKYILVLVAALLTAPALVTSCSEDFLDVQPTETITDDQLKELGDESPEAMKKIIAPQVSGLYSWLIQYNSMERASVRHSDFGVYNIFIMTDLMNVDMVQNTQNYGWYYPCYNFTQRPDYAHVDNFMPWGFFYKLIYNCNSIISLFNDEVSDAELLHFKGQAFAMRAYAYYYLVQLYQHTYVGHENDPAVPILTEQTTEEEKINNPRAPVQAVYDLILSDLTQAYDLLDGFTRATKAQVDQQVVAGLLARTYLTMEDGANAAMYAHIARTGYTLSTAEWDYTDRTTGGFMSIAEPDWMWGCIVTSQSDIATSGIVNPISHLGSLNYGYTTAGNMQKLIDAKLYASIPETDIRFKAFAAADGEDAATGYGVPKYANLKFGPYSLTSDDNYNDYPLMRSAEMYLIEAEGLALDNKTGDAQDVLYEFALNRDPAAVKSSATGNHLRREIYWQRRVELWGEGFSYFDHKRLKLPIERTYDGTNHRADALFDFPAEHDVFRFRIPLQETSNNPALGENNP